jgi:abortive infection bacteriophage resistance protein
MQYLKPVLSVADSVLRLQQKGLAVAGVADAERFIRAIGYFRFRGYALPFMQPAPAGFAYGSRLFVPGTTFEQIQQLYDFDRSLRSLVMEQMDRIEVAVRTAILQELNARFGPHWYLDFSKQIFKEAADQAKWFGDVAREVERSKRQPFIVHYQATYTSPRLPPSWAVAECLSFGKWSILYEQLAHGKSAIASQFGLSAPVLQSWLHSLNQLRNACAHHGRIWNRSLPFEPKSHPHYLTHFVQPARFYSRAAVIRIMTNVIDGNGYFADGLRYLFHSYPSLNALGMGFRTGWEADPLWA